jgi:flavin reductase (DIM6/NTAB) family NADH-FMN oxidoreductase RutF/DNA-binding transcriptional LysR family regulator
VSALGVRQDQPNIRAQFIEGMSRAAFCVNVVTTDGPAGRAGVTISAMSSVSADGSEPTVLVCIHHQSKTAAAILENRTFCVNVLRDDQSDIADCFGGRVDREDGDKFACASWVEGGTRAPRLVNPVVAFDCRLLSDELVGTHYVFIGAVESVTKGSGTALIYTDRAYGRTQWIAPQAKTTGARPHLTIGCHQEFASYVMADLLTRISAAHPSGVTSLVDGDQRRIVDCLRSGQTDAALLFDFDLDDDISTTVLAEWQPYVLLPAAHPFVDRPALALADLADEPLIELDLHPNSVRYRALFEADGLSRRLGTVTRSPDIVRTLVGRGFGYSLLAAKSAEALVRNDPALVARPLATPVAPIPLVLATVRRADITPQAETFRTICYSYFSGHHREDR